ncbi:alpha/beta hydrolase [Flavobacterium geliluteum]|nr:alpha/beta hydrolase [Flavobacterium geliluteum]
MKHIKQSLAAFIFTLINLNTSIMTQTIPGEKDPNISKDTRVFLKALNSGDEPPLEKLAPKDARQVLIGAQNSISYDYSDIEESEREITQDGKTMTIHIVKPQGANDDLPVFMFFHGGGWVLGDYPTHKRLVRDLVVQSGAVAVFPDYTPTPDAQFPVAINQAYAATKWVSENGKSIGVDGSRLAVAGNSVGGNMSTVVALMAKDKNDFKIAFQLLLWPLVDADMNRPSYKKFAQGRFLTTATMKWMWDMYLTKPEDRKQKYVSPINASLEELKGLPPALIQVAENDILYDEGVAYGRKLDEAGVPTTITVYKGMIHDYGMLNPLSHIPAVQEALTQASVVLRKALFTK